MNENEAANQSRRYIFGDVSVRREFRGYNSCKIKHCNALKTRAPIAGYYCQPIVLCNNKTTLSHVALGSCSLHIFTLCFSCVGDNSLCPSSSSNYSPLPTAPSQIVILFVPKFLLSTFLTLFFHSLFISSRASLPQSYLLL